jgi:hydrogenase/urease accessory protein HupE
MFPYRFFTALAVLLFCFPDNLQAHAIPDVPVRTSFDDKGAFVITVEINPRCFEADPNKAPSLLKSDLDAKQPTEREALLTKAATFANSYVEYSLLPQGKTEPSFKYTFSGEAGVPLTKPEDIVVMTGTATGQAPAGSTGYRIHAKPENTLSVLFLNTLHGQSQDRMQVLFPGEDSFTLNLTSGAGEKPASMTLIASEESTSDAGELFASFSSFVRSGFHHVVPEGLDHILFVLGLFLLSRAWRPLLWQVTTFTVAHTLTLGLATLGLVHVSSRVVEPIIAGSIAVVAIENIFHPRYTPWRLLLVFGFGLVHGLGFASALSDMALPDSSLIIGLLGFNVGVEGGQLAVITLATILTFWVSNQVVANARTFPGLKGTLTNGSPYRRFVVVPGSIAIACTGLFWMVQRIIG